jgi:hypothetical protein
MVSGTVPAVLLALGALGWLLPELSRLLAEAVVVLRLAATGIFVWRISGNASPLVGLWSGFALAGISVVIAALKEILTHGSRSSFSRTRHLASTTAASTAACYSGLL